MNNFSIKDIEMLSGIKAHTFRIWEQRHGLCFCKRKVSQHRYYDNEDLKAVLRVAFLYHRGYKISKLAKHSKDEILKLTSGSINEVNYDSYVHQLIESTIDYDAQRFEKIIQNSVVHFGFEQSIERVFYPFMQKVGMLWVTEHVIPAQEHFSCSLIQQKILVAIDRLRTVPQNPNEVVLIFAPEEEHHEIPLLVASYFFRKRGVKTVYFGINVPVAQVEYYCSNKNVTHFFIHVITNFLNMDIAEYLNALAAKFPQVKILASGPAIDGKPELADSVRLVHSFENLIPAMSR